jgi:hypothetical protein
MIGGLKPILELGETLSRDMLALSLDWNDHEILSLYLSDTDYCLVATTGAEGDDDRLDGFILGTINEDPRESLSYGYLFGSDARQITKAWE